MELTWDGGGEHSPGKRDQIQAGGRLPGSILEEQLEPPHPVCLGSRIPCGIPPSRSLPARVHGATHGASPAAALGKQSLAFPSLFWGKARAEMGNSSLQPQIPGICCPSHCPCRLWLLRERALQIFEFPGRLVLAFFSPKVCWVCVFSLFFPFLPGCQLIPGFSLSSLGPRSRCVSHPSVMWNLG